MCELNSYSKVIKCDSPEELLNKLEFKDVKYAKRNRFIFRGQCNACWGLIPSVFRTGANTSYDDNTKGHEKHLIAQVGREKALLKAFAQESNRIGLEIPDHLDTFIGGDHSTIETYPKPEIIEFMSLAQHHGVPTRLLDFTFNPYVACYFAATGNKQNSNNQNESDIAVWAIYKDVEKFVPRIRFYEPLRAKNKYLYAQDGLFLLDRGLNSAWGNGVPSFDIGKTIVGEVKQRTDIVKSLQFLEIEIVYKFVISQKYVDNLLFTLEQRGINHASISPSYENVVKSLEAQRERKIRWNRDLRNAFYRK